MFIVRKLDLGNLLRVDNVEGVSFAESTVGAVNKWNKVDRAKMRESRENYG